MALRKVLIGDVCRIYSGGDAPKIISDKKTADCPIPVYSNGLQDEGLYGYTNEAQIEGDVVSLTARGANSGVVFYRKEPFLPIVRLISIIPDRTRINSRYLYYLLKTKVFLASKTGAAQPQITIPAVAREEISYEIDIRTQIHIADILSAYDNLIENNQKQIKLLEEAAQRLYKEWFIDLRFPGHETTKIQNDLPEGWQEKSVSTLGEFLNGFAFKPSDWFDKGLPIIKIKEMGGGVSKDTPRNKGERVPQKYLVKAGDILFSWSATLMAMVWNDENGWLNQHIFKVVPEKGICREFLLQSLKNTIDEFSNLTTGSTMKHIQRGKLDQVFVKVPNEGLMKKYELLANSIREQILTLSKKINLLQESRDRLLPKLMSGEIEV